MEELIKSIKSATTAELYRAKKVKGEKFIDMHQGYAVILEEVQEAEEELERVKSKLNVVWGAIRRNEYPNEAIAMLDHHAKLMAAESVQIAAMARKFHDSFMEG